MRIWFRFFCATVCFLQFGAAFAVRPYNFGVRRIGTTALRGRLGVGRIVFSAMRYGSDEHGPDGVRQIDNAYHLFVVNPDGSGRRRLTYGSDGDFEPRWSPDGRQILFCRYNPHHTFVCVIRRLGAPVRRVYDLGSDVSVDSAASVDWAPNGRMAAVALDRTIDSKTLSCVVLLNVDRDRAWLLRKIPEASDFAWSPDSRRLYVGYADGRDRIFDVGTGRWIRVASPVWGAVWLDDDTILGTVPEPHGHLVDLVRAIRSDGTLKWQRTLSPSLGLQNDWPIRSDEVWHKVPLDPTHVFLELHARFENGGENTVFRVALPSMRNVALANGHWCGVSPDGKLLAVAEWEHVTYNPASIRVGPVDIVTVKTDHCRAVTWALGAVDSGDWR